MTGSVDRSDPLGRHRAVLGLGANLADPLRALRGAVASLSTTPGIEILACSQAYRTDPVGGPQQPRYLNAVVILRTDAAPTALLSLAQGIEADWGRVRRERWGPRTLDIDLIDVDGEVRVTSDLTLPHPRAHERGFVLVPWLDIDPEAVLPGFGRVCELLNRVDCTGIEATDQALLDGLASGIR